MSMQTLSWDVDVAANSDAYSLASATQARQQLWDSVSTENPQRQKTVVKSRVSNKFLITGVTISKT